MNDSPFRQCPVVIGGVGGSGTRIIAQFLIDLRFYLGADLNAANDNLWFTLLFKRPRWYIKQQDQAGTKIFSALRIFEKAMTNSAPFKVGEILFIGRAAAQMALRGHDHIGSGSGSWAAARFMTLLRSRYNSESKFRGWGWKEPNTHIYLAQLSEYFRNLRYIHVMRHGLDMAFSRNQAQLFNWGKLYRISRSSAGECLPKASLSYWIKSNEAAIDLGTRLLGNRFLLVNFDELCVAPERMVEQIVGFLGLDHRQVDLNRLSSLPKIPTSAGRYRQYDLSIFTEGQLNAVRRLGFSVEAQSYKQGED